MVDVLKILIPAVLTFFLGIFITPFFTNLFYKYRMWKKNPRTESGDYLGIGVAWSFNYLFTFYYFSDRTYERFKLF